MEREDKKRFALKSCHGNYVRMPFGEEPLCKNDKNNWGAKLKFLDLRNLKDKKVFVISKQDKAQGW